MTTITVAAQRLASLSIVLPCFNEAPNVTRAVAEARAAAERYAEAHDGNRGYGAAVNSGLMASTSEWVLLTDGDLQFDLAELDNLLPHAREHDMVCGYRIDRADNALRRASAHAWNALVERSFGIGVRDVD